MLALTAAGILALSAVYFLLRLATSQRRSSRHSEVGEIDLPGLNSVNPSQPTDCPVDLDLLDFDFSDIVLWG